MDLARGHLKKFERACARKEKLAAEGRAAAAQRKQQLEEARAELLAAEPKLQSLQAAKDEAEVQEAARKADRERRIAAGEIASALKLSQLTPPMIMQAIARLALAQGVAGVDKLHEFLTKHESTQALMDDVDSADLLELAMDARDDTTKAGESEEKTCAAHEACGFEGALVEMLPLGGLAEPVLRELLSSFNELTGQTTLLAKAPRRPWPQPPAPRPPA